jgi:hypothetical protein
MWLPQYRIARFIITRIVKLVGADVSLSLIFKSLLSSLPGLILSFGVLPVFGVLWRLGRYASNGVPFAMLPLHTLDVLNKYNPLIVKTVLDSISPYWDTCLFGIKGNKILFRTLTASPQAAGGGIIFS